MDLTLLMANSDIKRLSGAKSGNLVRISTPIAKGESLPTLTKTKGMFALLMLSESTGKPNPGDIYSVPVEVLRDLLNCRDDHHLRVELESLAGLKLNWEKFDKRSRGFTTPVSSCRWVDGNIVYAFDPQFVVAWQDNDIGFKRISFVALTEFSSVYGAKLYELCAFLYQPGKTVKSADFSKEEIRHFFGVHDDRYPGGTFKQSVITVAVNQVNNSALGFSVTYVQEGRGDTGRHWFEIMDGPKQERLRISPAKKIGALSQYDRIVETLNRLSSPERSRIEDLLKAEGLPKLPNPDSYIDLTQFAAALYRHDITLVPQIET